MLVFRVVPGEQRFLLPAAPWARATALLGAWTLLGIVFGLQLHGAARAAGRALPLGLALGWQLVEWHAWGALAPGIWWLARRFHGHPLEPGDTWSRVRAAAGVLLGALVVSLSHPAVVATLHSLVPALNPEDRTWAQIYAFLLSTRWAFGLVIYAGLFGTMLAVLARQRWRADRERAAALEAQLAVARLAALQSQLQPHFLFNALNAVAGLVHARPDDAERMIARLGDLLRATLEAGADRRPAVPLDEELALAGKYLAVEQVRFADRLQVREEIDPAARTALVPALILQPLVENAVRHGISRRPGPGEIILRAHVAGPWLELSVADDGNDEPASSRERRSPGGVGLANVRARLAEVCGEGGWDLALRPRSDGRPGMEAWMKIPLVLPPAATAIPAKGSSLRLAPTGSEVACQG